MREKIEYLDAESYGSVNDYINRIEEVIYPKIRLLESDYEELEKQKTWRIGEIQRQIRVNNNYQSSINELENKLQIAMDTLEILSNVKTAYPEDVFPPLVKVQYKLLCDAAGISVDRVSAHVLRSVAKGHSELADETIDKINKP